MDDAFPGGVVGEDVAFHGGKGGDAFEHLEVLETGVGIGHGGWGVS